MPIYKIQNQKLSQIQEDSFKLEKEIQSLTEANLQGVFWLDFVKTEFALNSLRIDTLAFNPETRGFVVIEYKRDRNFSVIDQGYAYLSLMLNNKADFILEYNENTGKNLKREDVDWTQSRVIFVSPAFSKYQKQAINFKDLPIELWEISKYRDGLVQYARLESPENSESIAKVSKSGWVIEKVSKEVTVYSEEALFTLGGEDIRNLYEEFKNQVLSLDDKIEVIPWKHYIAFRMGGSNFLDVLIQKKELKFYLNVEKWKLNDPYGLGKDCSEKGHLWNGDYEFVLTGTDQFVELMPLVKQSYEKAKSRA